MKKHFYFSILILLMLTLLTGCAAARRLDTVEDRMERKIDAVEDHMEQNAGQFMTTMVTPAPDENIYSSPTPDQITEGEAMEIALKHAGFTADQVQYLHTDYEIDDRVPQYDISFHVDRLEYAYEIHAETGEILSFETDD